MEITKVNINPQSSPEHKDLLAFVEIVFDDCFLVRGVRIIQLDNGRRLVGMPTRRLKQGHFQDVANPIRKEFRTYLEKTVLDEYNARVGKS